MGLGDIGDFIDENWHGGTIDGDFYSHPEMPIEENADAPKKSPAPVWNWEAVLSRELMRGLRADQLLKKYSVLAEKFGVSDEVKAFLDKYYCVLGWFLVDVSRFDDGFGYYDIPSKMRSCNLYAVGSTELREIISRSLVSENDGSFDGLFGGDHVEETVVYEDEKTGLPCIESWDEICDDGDERLSSIADRFFSWGWISQSERDAFDEREGKLGYLVGVVRRASAPKSNATGKFDDVVSDYGVKDQELEADSEKAIKDADVKNIHELMVDDIGEVGMPEKVEVGDVRDMVVDDIGDIRKPEAVVVRREVRPSDFEEDVDVRDYAGTPEVTLHELSRRDYDPDIEFDNMSDFVIEDLKDMKDDEFDYADLNDGNIDLEEMVEEDAPGGELDIDAAQKPYEVSSKYDWSW